MLEKTKGIVLNTIKYTESSIIANIYTREFGKQSFIIQGVRSKKTGKKANLLQPLFLLELETDIKGKRELQRIKDMHLNFPFHSIPFDITKNSICFFIAEVLHKTLSDNDFDKDLYDFLEKTLIEFDELEKGKSIFHLYFLISYLKYIGFYPDVKLTVENKYFDLNSGHFVKSLPLHENYFSKEESLIFEALLSATIEDLKNIEIRKNQKTNLIDKLLFFYRFHNDTTLKIKSLEVLRTVFER